jgi:hypothetical protein
MSINVTPIPRLIDLATPALTLGTANTAGSAETAISSNSTLLVFDAVTPAAVAASGAVGSATVTARRDHVHAGTTASGTVVDEAITRFDGTSGASLQGYSSLSPTISDDGVISLTSGALKFPATAINSANANTLDDYEEGTWTPVLTDGSNNATNHSNMAARYTKIGRMVYIQARLWTSSLGSVSGNISISGLPFTPANISNLTGSISVANGQNLSVTAGFNVGLQVLENTTSLLIKLWDGTGGSTTMQSGEWTADGLIDFGGSYQST